MRIDAYLLQSYTAENNTVKINDETSVLTVSVLAGSGSVDDFQQIYKIPQCIDLDPMTSSIGSDGILANQAPRMTQ